MPTKAWRGAAQLLQLAVFVGRGFSRQAIEIAVASVAERQYAHSPWQKTFRNCIHALFISAILLPIALAGTWCAPGVREGGR